MKDYQTDFIAFLVDSGALTFGDFITKSGRATPYFINSGNFNTGERISRLGEFYAKHIASLSLGEISCLFGPAYKGVPLAVTTSIALKNHHNINCGYSFNRKEEKSHGDKGMIVGFPINHGCRVVIVEDVITAGTTLIEVVPKLRAIASIDLLGVVVAVDRQERASGTKSAISELQQLLGINIFPIVTISDILQYLSSSESGKYRLSAERVNAIREYLEQYGVT